MEDKPKLPKLKAVGADEAPPKKPRSLSTVSFPYSDLAETESAARQLAASFGHCRPEQLAAWLGHRTLNSGAFRNKVAAARLFGVLESNRNSIQLTRLGRRIVDDETSRQARVEAFLSVPVYRSIFESHRGERMPGAIGLELELIRLGVSRTQVQAARQVFMRSAAQAGFFETGPHQLVLPRGTGLPGDSQRGERPAPTAAGRYPRLIEATLEQAPWGEPWSEAEFEEWAGLLVRAARVHFKLPGDPGRVSE